MLPKSTSASSSGVVVLRHGHLPQGHGLAPAGLAYVAPHGRFADVGTVLFDLALPRPPSGVALLFRRLLVGLQSAVDGGLPGVQHWRHSRWPRLARRRDRRR